MHGSPNRHSRAVGDGFTGSSTIDDAIWVSWNSERERDWRSVRNDDVLPPLRPFDTMPWRLPLVPKSKEIELYEDGLSEEELNEAQ